MGGRGNATILTGGQLGRLLRVWRERPGVSFGVGVPGALAEFHAMPSEATVWRDLPDAMEGRCSGGAIAVRLRDGVLPVVYDLESRRPGRRVRGALFCLPESEAALAGSSALREAGARKGRRLFDIGVGARGLDALVAVRDEALAAILARAEGERIVGTHHCALAALVEASPPRLFRSALAEICVTQPIARETTPEGPHTHLLPALLDGRDCDPRIPVPAGRLPGLAMHIPDDDAAFASLARRFGAAVVPHGGLS